MPLLLEDLAEETSASNRRIANRLDEETHRLEELQREATNASRDLPQEAREAAEQATEHIRSRVEQAESIWGMAVKALHTNPLRDDAENLILGTLRLLESGRVLFPAPRKLWALAMVAGTERNRLAELEQLEKRLETLIAEAASALQHRKAGWQPADPERLTLGLQLSRAGRTVKADEARTRFRRTKG